MIDLDHKKQSNWPKIIEASIYTMSALARKHGINKRTMQSWLCSETRDWHSKPSKENRKKMLKAMRDAKKNPAPPFSPSYGYAYPEQIDQIRSAGISPERDKIISELKFQNRRKGKIYREQRSCA